MGSIDLPNGANDAASYSVPEETRKVFEQGILANPLITKDLPAGTADFAKSVKFVGNAAPSIPINWRFAESAASLKGLEASVIAQLIRRKFGKNISGATINTDHAQLFFMSTLIWSMGEVEMDLAAKATALDDVIPNTDLHKATASLYRACATNIYETKDKKWFHLHSSMNARPTQDSIGLPYDGPSDTWEEALQPYIDRLAEIDSDDMQRRAADEYKQAGTICETVESFKQTEHGKANAHVGLFEIHESPNPSQPPCWWPDSPETSPQRPLAGCKVVDLCRIIAAPAITRGLAELGASVMRVTCPNITDMSTLHVDLNWGKWNCSINLKTEEGCHQLRSLISDADVVVQGYRPGVLDKYGFGQQGIIDLVKDRARGIISARENCYGWNGPWWYRSGWQQISDACVGISAQFGKRMGHDEPVTPVFPNSDYMTGIAGVVGILSALMRRAEKGGSYKVDCALNYYNQWLANSCGEYPAAVWEDVWARNGKQVFRARHNMLYTIPRYLEMIKKNSGPIVMNPKFFEERHSKAIDRTIRTIRPIISFDNDEVKLGYNVGTRGNGKDAPRWPEDLMTEVVS